MEQQVTQLKLCSASDIPERASRGFDPEQTGQDTIFIVRFNGQIRGWLNACPHINGAPMAWRKDEYLNPGRTHIACHAHGALFHPQSGECIQGPCLGKKLQAVSVNETEDGEIFIDPSKIIYSLEEK